MSNNDRALLVKLATFRRWLEDKVAYHAGHDNHVAQVAHSAFDLTLARFDSAFVLDLVAPRPRGARREKGGRRA